MLDYKYHVVKIFQNIVKISNKFQLRFIKDYKINLRWDERILIIKWDRIWDAVWTIRFIKLLKIKFPSLKINVLCNDYNKFVFDENVDLINNIYSINQNPPGYFLKDFFNFFSIIIDPIKILLWNIRLLKSLKSWWYDYVLNLTWRNFFLVSKYLWNSVWGWVGVFNFLYKYPIKLHNEIGSQIHIIDKRVELFWIQKPLYQDMVTPKIKKVLLFKGWKSLNKLTEKIYEIIVSLVRASWRYVQILADSSDINADYYLEKKSDWFYVSEIKLKDFLRDYDLFIWVDWGVLHYSAQFINTIWIYLNTNYLAAHQYWTQINWENFPEEISIYIIKDKMHFVISSGANCWGCFQLWCEIRKCLKSLDIRIEIIIKSIVSYLWK